MKAQKLIVIAAIVCLLLVASGNVEAATVERDGDNVTAIRDLEVGGIIYDVDFCSNTSAAHYGDPPIFDFGTSAEAKTAVEAVNAILNAEGGVKTVGNPGCPGNPPLGPIFRVGFDAVELNIPIPFFGEITIRLTKVWESVTGDNPPEQGVWVIPEDWDVFPFLDDGIFANFTAVDSTSSGNMPPSADAGAPILGEVGVEVSFDGSGSGDTDGTIVAYNWIFGDGNTGTGPTVSHTYVVADIYNVILEVTDDSGKTASDSTVAIIGLLGQGNLPPEADAGASASGVVGEEVSFDGTGSNDPDGTIVAYIWDFGDGNSGTGPTPTHTYSTVDTYNVTLAVIDDTGMTDSDGTTAEISAQQEQEANVILDGNNNVIRIENLKVLDLTGNITVYNVDFVYDTAINVYGAGLGFDFPVAANALAALEAVTDALNSNVPVPSGASTFGTDQFFIGNLERMSRIGALGGENIGGVWDQCEKDCIAGVAILDPGDPFTYAKFHR